MKLTRMEPVPDPNSKSLRECIEEAAGEIASAAGKLDDAIGQARETNNPRAVKSITKLRSELVEFSRGFAAFVTRFNGASGRSLSPGRRSG